MEEQKLKAGLGGNSKEKRSGALSFRQTALRGAGGTRNGVAGEQLQGEAMEGEGGAEKIHHQKNEENSSGVRCYKFHKAGKGGRGWGGSSGAAGWVQPQ